MKKRVIVTGFNRGLGFQITNYLIEKDYIVIGLGRRNVDELSKYKDRFLFKEIDLRNLDTIKDLFLNDEDIQNFPIHGLVNNAAIAYDDLITNLNVTKLNEMFNVNVFAVFVLTKYAIRNALLHKQSLSIVNISSISAHTGYKGLAMYGATKGALEAFTKNCAREWGRLNVRCNCVVPGFMETDMSSSISDDLKKKIYSRTCLGKATSLVDVAALTEFLLSDNSSSITGQSYLIDSGTI